MSARAQYRREAHPLTASESVQDAWSGLVEAAGANFSLAPAWTRIVAESHGLDDSVELVAVYRGSELVAALPVFVDERRKLGLRFRTLELVGNRVSYHNSLVTVLDAGAAMDVLLEIAAEKRVDIVRLANVPDDSALAAWLDDNTLHNGFRVTRIATESSPYLPITMSWDDLLASKPKKFRYKARKRAEALNTEDAMSVRMYTTMDDCGDLLSAIRTIEEHSWKQAAGISVFDRDHERRYFELLLPAIANEGAMFAHVLFRDERPIAYNLCCVHRGWVGQMKTSFDTRYSTLSPGSTLIDIGIRTAIEKGASEFDFLGDADKHKTAWSKHIRHHTDYFLYLDASIRARILALLKSLKSGAANASSDGEG